MNYLDERIIANIDLESQSGSYITTTGMYRFFIYDDTDPSKNLFVGNTFLQENTMKAYIDITDFARNYCANKTSVVRLDVAVRVNDSTERTDEIEILPIYRYPNAKADDNQYNFGSYDTFLYSGKQTFDRSFYKSNSLFPTYPQIATDKIKIDYLYGAKKAYGYSSFTFDYGPTYSVKNAINNTPALFNLNYPLAYGSTTDVNPLVDYSENWSTLDGDPTITFENKYVTYQYSYTVPASEVIWNFAGGTDNDQTIDSYPFSLTISNTDYAQDIDYICDFYIENSNAAGTILNTFPLIKKGNYTCEVVCKISEEMKTLDGSGVDWTDWEYTNNYWTTQAYNPTVGQTLISVRFTNTSGDYILELDETLVSAGVTWEWDQTLDEVTEAKIYFDSTSYETAIPLEIVNNTEGDNNTYKNLVFTLQVKDGFPVLYVNYSKYTATVKYNATRSIIVPLADDIVVYAGNRYSYTKTDNDFTFEVDGDLTVRNNTVYATQLCKSLKATFYQNGVASKVLLTVSVIQSGYMRIYETPIGDSYILLEYFDENDEYRSGRVYIKPTNPLSDAYYYTSVGYSLYAGNTFKINLVGTALFAKLTDKAVKIGQFSCPSGYYILWKDRLGSQQCQPFNKVDTYSEEITGNEITNYWGKRSLYEVEVQPKWKVQTNWITDTEYRCYEGLFVSPWVKLYDADSDIIYDVIIKDRNYTEKTFLNQGKLFNLELTVEAAEKQNIIY